MQESRLTVDSSMCSRSSFLWCFSLSCRITPDELPQPINLQYTHFCMAQSYTGYFTVTLTSLIASIHNSFPWLHWQTPFGLLFWAAKGNFAIFHICLYPFTFSFLSLVLPLPYWWKGTECCTKTCKVANRECDANRMPRTHKYTHTPIKYHTDAHTYREATCHKEANELSDATHASQTHLNHWCIAAFRQNTAINSSSNNKQARAVAAEVELDRDRDRNRQGPHNPH